jgi:IS4 transposase
MLDTTYAHHIPAHSKKPRWQKLRKDMTAARRSQSFTGHTIDTLQNLHERLGFWPKGLVFDRGFGNESIVTHLAAEGATFYIRLKGGRYVEADGQRTEVKQLMSADATIWLYGLTLRVIRSPKSRRAKEPWYILTNDMSSSPNKVVTIYYHRFEIEETFKDTKHLFELKRLSFTKPNSLKVVLWLVFLGIAVLYVITKPSKQQMKTASPKKYISWVRAAYERFQRTLTQQRALTGLAPRSGVVR